MKQILQSLATGETQLVELPAPAPGPGQLLVRSSCSLVSAGTERMLVHFGKAGWAGKARQQPERVRDVLDKVRSDGLLTTVEAVRSKLDQPLPLGYCNVGTVVALGEGVHGFSLGQRVVSNGPHAELVAVPRNLCAAIPEGVCDETAAFTVLAAIGLQGVRLAQPSFGETVLVSGLGLIGLLTAQLLRAQGCRVLGLDPSADACALARSLGVEVLQLGGADPVVWCQSCTDGIGVDAVLITAATSSSEPVHVAAQSCRQRGRIVLVGVTGLELRRDLFYKKELSFQVSCSYGPGRYDPAYEQGGLDYPIGFVRWTEQRNFAAVLQSMAQGQLQTDALISHRFGIAQAAEAYDLLSSDTPSLGILLSYPQTADPAQRAVLLSQDEPANRPPAEPCLSVLGAGNHAARTLVPALARAGARFDAIAASQGMAPAHVGRRHGFALASTDVGAVLRREQSNAVVIATRHDSHARLICEALEAGKHCYVEKPLCLNSAELEQIERVYEATRAAALPPLLMVGFNRRFAPLVVELRRQLHALSGPRVFVYTCNAGAIPAAHWTQDPASGGGRLLGEACHFVDLLRHLAGSPIDDLQLTSAADAKPCPDTFSLQLRFADGSIGTVHYLANGHKAFPKERLEVFAGGRVLQLDNYRKLRAWGVAGFKTRRLWSQDKGQNACAAAFVTAIREGTAPQIASAELFEVQRWLLQIAGQ
jgi:predicted dehydrogenase/threonine dehydrogenase-like Zn-dependent dehydrogenase